MVTSFSLCFSDPSTSSVTFSSFLSLVIWPRTLAGTDLRTTNALSTEKPSTPLSWSQPCASTMGRTSHWLALSTKRRWWAELSLSKEGGSAGSGAGMATCLVSSSGGGGASSSSPAGSSSR